MAEHGHTAAQRRRLKRRRTAKSKPSKAKARKILEDGEVNGKRLTDKQRAFFRAILDE